MPTSSKVAAGPTGRADGIAAVCEETERTKSEADAKAARAAADVQIAEAAVGAAEAAHAATPNDDGARVLGAHDALRLARVRRDMAAKHAADATEGHRIALAALEHHESERHIAELQRRSEPATLADAIDGPWAEILNAYARIQAAAFKIREAYLASTAASAELRSRGVYVQDLEPVHVVRVPLARAVARGLGTTNLLAVSPTISAHVVDPTVEILGALQRIESLAPGPHSVGLARQLSGLATCRTSIDLAALERDHAKREAVGALDGYTPPTRQRATPQ